MFITTDTILANLLHNDNGDGIDMGDISNFVRKVLNETKDNCLCFETDDNAIDDALLLYPDIFKRYQNRIYLKNDLNLEYFNEGYPKYLIDVFKKVAK